MKETLWRVTYKKKKKQGMGISYFKIRNQPKIKKNGKNLNIFFPLSVNGTTYSAVENSLEMDYFSF